MRGAAFLKQPIRGPEPDRLASSIISMESAKTYSELETICRNIEARHSVEGISGTDERAYELVKAAHVKRVAGTFAT